MGIVTQSCLTLCNPMDCRPPGSSVHGILQVSILEWVAIPSPGIFLTQGSNLHLLWLLGSRAQAQQLSCMGLVAPRHVGPFVWPMDSLAVVHGLTLKGETVPDSLPATPNSSNTNSWSLLKLMSIESVMPSNHPILCFLPGRPAPLGLRRRRALQCLSARQAGPRMFLRDEVH